MRHRVRPAHPISLSGQGPVGKSGFECLEWSSFRETGTMTRIREFAVFSAETVLIVGTVGNSWSRPAGNSGRWSGWTGVLLAHCSLPHVRAGDRFPDTRRRHRLGQRRNYSWTLVGWNTAQSNPRSLQLALCCAEPPLVSREPPGHFPPWRRKLQSRMQSGRRYGYG